EAGRRVQEELRRPATRLERIQRGGSLEGTDLAAIDRTDELGLEDHANPRTAPAAPTDRALPVAIFEEEKVRVESGRWWDHPKVNLLRRTLDADRDGHPELVRYVDAETGHLFRQEEDRNYDGVTDAWSDYRSGVVVARVLDSNDDGNPDVWERYHGTRMTVREIDRDDDGVRDAFYRYEGGSLIEERHDADNDGRVDLRIVYADRRRIRDEEDQDKDGRMDTWRSYVVTDGVELVSRIERDKKGRGFADTFETFGAQDGVAVLLKREEDVNGDGEVDIISHYENGKLVRREIANPDLVPL
ncbi:MAG: hypothetical protein O7G30_09120, partial [Proteobacteria bacterium]|nr:hypothetical protein [Pseudomonadota bacterium]